MWIPLQSNVNFSCSFEAFPANKLRSHRNLVQFLHLNRMFFAWCRFFYSHSRIELDINHGNAFLRHRKFNENQRNCWNFDIFFFISAHRIPNVLFFDFHFLHASMVQSGAILFRFSRFNGWYFYLDSFTKAFKRC